MLSRRLDQLAGAFIGHRRRVIAAIIALAVLGGLGLLRLETDFSPDSVSGSLAGEADRKERFRSVFGNTDNVVLVLVSADDALSPRVLAYVHELTQALSSAEFSAFAASITSIPMVEGELTAADDLVGAWKRGALKLRPTITGKLDQTEVALVQRVVGETPLIRGKLLSRDDSLAVIAVGLTREIDSDPEIAPVIEEIERRVSKPPKGIEVGLSGLPYIRTDLARRVAHDQKTLFPIAFGLIFLLLLVMFRWLPAMLFPTVAIGISCLVVLGTMGLVGIPMDIISSIVPVLIIIIGVSDAIHLMSRYGEELARGLDEKRASRIAMRQMLVALFLTSLTTAAGFASLAASELVILRRFGVISAAAMLVAYAVTAAFLPAALASCRRPRREPVDSKNGFFERTATPVTTTLLRHKAVVLVVAALVVAGLTWVSATTKIESSVFDQYEVDDEVRLAIEQIENKLDGVSPIELVVEAPASTFASPQGLSRLQALAQRWRENDLVISITTQADVLRQSARTLRGAKDLDFSRTSVQETRSLSLASSFTRAPGFIFVDDTYGIARVSVSTRIRQDKELIDLAHAMRADAKERFGPAAKVWLTGEGYVTAKGLGAIVRDLLRSLAIAAFVIALLLLLLLRDLRLAVISIFPNVVPLLGTIAYMRWREIPLNTATAVIFSISIGLAVDGTIHLLARFLEEYQTHKDRVVALTAAVRGTGKAVCISYMALVIGFAVFHASAFLPIQRFGELISVTVFLCLVSTMFLLPPMVAAFWRPNSKD